MKKLTYLILIAVFFIGTPTAWSQQAPPGDNVFREIAQELGFVPEFFYAIPDRTLRDQWNLFKDMFLRADGPLTPKEKELIGLAVAGMKMCDYCLPMHHALARYHGATEEEINEVAQVARSVGQWSTFFYSIDYPLEQFEKELRQIINNLP